MKATKLLAIDKNIEHFDGDLLIFCIPEAVDGNLTYQFIYDNVIYDNAVENRLKQAHKLGDFTGKEGQTLLMYNDSYIEKTIITNVSHEEENVAKQLKSHSFSARRMLAVGLGKINKSKTTKELKKEKGNLDVNSIREILRKAGGSIATVSAKVKASQIMVTLPDIDRMITLPVQPSAENGLIQNNDSISLTDADDLGDKNVIEKISPSDVAESLAEGILLGDYRFLKYKKEKTDEPEYKGLKEVTFFSKFPLAPIRKALKRAITSSQAVYDARDMANEPGNGWRASDFASYAKELAKNYDLNCTVIDKDKMKKLGMGGVLAVNQGSSEPPTMVILEYIPEANKSKSKIKSETKESKSKEQQDESRIDTILLVGKGLTFDSGGICLKQPSGMEDMKYDMCGGAAVITVMQAVGKEKPENVGVVAIIPATDNLSGSSAMKPGDVIKHYSGVTSEIVNTDAEGRMILADALAYGIETFKPSCVIDIATLTGAAIMGLGHHYSAVLGNNDKLINRLEAAAKRAGEPLWRLPLGKEYSKQIESKVADIKNTGGKSAGTITAAAYLEHFVGDTPWAHIDIAGTAWDFTEKSYIPKGPSGIGVRTFIELIRSWK